MRNAVRNSSAGFAKTGLLLGCLGALLVGLVLFALYGVGVYNRLVGLDEAVKRQWSQVENQYQRRYDLIPNLVRTVQGAADFERGTLQAVVEARARVGQVALPGGAPGSAPSPTENPAAFQQFEAAQAGLSSASPGFSSSSSGIPSSKRTRIFSSCSRSSKERKIASLSSVAAITRRLRPSTRPRAGSLRA